jgi:hypothetical protein
MLIIVLNDQPTAVTGLKNQSNGTVNGGPRIESRIRTVDA